MKQTAKTLMPIAALIISLSLLLLGGCTTDEPALPAGEVTEAPIVITLGGSWLMGEGRAAPPGAGGNIGGGSGDLNDTESGIDIGTAETEWVDAVRIFTFRRAAGADDTTPFLYDISNDIIVDELTWDADDADDLFGSATHHNKIARAKLKKVKGYEYRIVAIAYSSSRQSDFASTLKVAAGEDNWFGFVKPLDENLSLDELQIVVNPHSLYKNDWSDFFSRTSIQANDEGIDKHLSHYAASIPQIFFGQCRCADAVDDIIRYEEGGSKTAPITGILYRGMAKVELKITPEKNTRWIALMAETTPTQAGLQDYDCFLSPSGTIASARKNNRSYTPVAFTEVDGTDEVTLTAYMLPTATRLLIRTKVSNSRYDKVVGGVEVSVTGGNATGIISPDLHDGIFYLRRNHKYVIRVSNPSNLPKL
ncbi:MAG: hypothetical protein NC342_01310 [Pseudoflavonifractor sp.]|nr:hypothetical protein [Pseudoflavonifractor sp.]